MKKALAFICVLALIVSMCSAFSFAAEPEAEKEEPTRTIVLYKVRSYSTYMYNTASTSSGYVFNAPIPIGTELRKLSTSGSFYYMSYTKNGTTYEGYVLQSHVEPI